MNKHLLVISLLAIIVGVSVPSVYAVTSANTASVTRADVFGNVPMTFDNYLIIPNPSKTINGINDAGSITLIDRTTDKTYVIDNPSPNDGDSFGEHIAVSDRHIIVGVPPESLDDGGVIYVFDGASRLLLYTIENPRGDVYGHFGRYLSIINDNIVTSDGSGENKQFNDSVYVFEASTGDLLYTIDTRYTASTNFRGYVTTTNDGKLLIQGYDFADGDTTNNVIHAFDASNGSFLYTINNLNNSDSDYSGLYITEINGNVIVGVPTCSYKCYDSSGIIHSFDSDTGELLYSIEYPNDGYDVTFGEYIMPVQGNIGVGLEDAIYVFDSNSGKMLYTVEYPQDKSFKNLLTFVEGLQNTDDSFGEKTYSETDSGLVLDTPQAVNSFGVPLESISTNDMVMIDSRIVNLLDTEQPFTFQVKVLDSGDDMVQERWISGAIAPKKDTHASISWIPENTGTYTAIVSVGSDLDSLNHSRMIDFTVSDDTITSCGEGLILVYKASDNLPICVRPHTAEKLVERGWAKPV